MDTRKMDRPHLALILEPEPDGGECTLPLFRPPAETVIEEGEETLREFDTLPLFSPIGAP